MSEQKVCAMELALNKLTEQQLLETVKATANNNHDGQFTIMAFTTGYRVGFYTPDLDIGFGKDGPGEYESYGRQSIYCVPQLDSLKEALVYAVMYEPVFGENMDEEIDEGTEP